MHLCGLLVLQEILQGKTLFAISSPDSAEPDSHNPQHPTSFSPSKAYGEAERFDDVLFIA